MSAANDFGQDYGERFFIKLISFRNLIFQLKEYFTEKTVTQSFLAYTVGKYAIHALFCDVNVTKIALIDFE